MRTILTATILAAGTIFAVLPGTPAKADVVLPYCTSGGPVTDGMCDFYTLQQCRAFVSGVGGTCVLNPRLAPNYNLMQYQPGPAAYPHRRYYGPARTNGPY